MLSALVPRAQHRFLVTERLHPAVQYNLRLERTMESTSDRKKRLAELRKQALENAPTEQTTDLSCLPNPLVAPPLPETEGSEVPTTFNFYSDPLSSFKSQPASVLPAPFPKRPKVMHDAIAVQSSQIHAVGPGAQSSIRPPLDAFTETFDGSGSGMDRPVWGGIDGAGGIGREGLEGAMMQAKKKRSPRRPPGGGGGGWKDIDASRYYKKSMVEDPWRTLFKNLPKKGRPPKQAPTDFARNFIAPNPVSLNSHTFPRGPMPPLPRPVYVQPMQQGMPNISHHYVINPDMGMGMGMMGPVPPNLQGGGPHGPPMMPPVMPPVMPGGLPNTLHSVGMQNPGVVMQPSGNNVVSVPGFNNQMMQGNEFNALNGNGKM